MWKIIDIASCIVMLVFVSSIAIAQEGKSSPEKSLILPGEVFQVGGKTAFIFWPEESKRQSPQPWVLYAPCLPAYPDIHEKWMHEQFVNAGIAVAGIDIGEAYGSPKTTQAFDELYAELVTRRGFAEKAILLGRSRGGLWVTRWASDRPERVAGIAGIYPVFDLRSYPGIQNAASAYELTAAELEKRIGEFNPIDRVATLAKSKIPVFIIHGDIDEVVPLEKNSLPFKQKYAVEGVDALVDLEVVKGQGHNYWEGFFRSQRLVDFVVSHKSGK